MVLSVDVFLSSRSPTARVAALFHDLELVDAYHTDAKRFEVDGADGSTLLACGRLILLFA